MFSMMAHRAAGENGWLFGRRTVLVALRPMAHGIAARGGDCMEVGFADLLLLLLGGHGVAGCRGRVTRAAGEGLS
jgi:hypothetical protein